MRFVLYSRKSTDTEDRQVLSLDAQERELLEVAGRLNLNVVNTYRESMSAKAPGRPVFAQVLKDIQDGKVDAILCWKLDRLARNFIDGGQIIDQLQRGVISSIHCFDKEYLPSDNVMYLAVEFGMANQFVRDLSVNVKRGNRQKLEQGGWPGRAPFGYFNNKADKTIHPDPKLVPYIKRAFDLYATGTYSLQEVTDILYGEGFRSKSGKKVHRGSIHRVLKRAFYCGVMMRDGRLYSGKHQALITNTLFDRVQDVMTGNSKPRRKRHHFPLSGLFNCQVCGCAITAQIQKGYSYYHCTNGKGICDQRPCYIRQEVLDEQIAAEFDKFQFDEVLVETMYQAALEKRYHDSSFQIKIQKNLENALANLEGKEKRLLDTYLGEQIIKDLYEVKVLEIQNERVNLAKQLEDQDKVIDPSEAIERTKNVFLASNRAKQDYLDGPDDKKRALAFKLLSNGKLKDRKIVSLQYRSPYDGLALAPKNLDILTMRGLWDDVVTAFLRQE